MVGTSLHGVRGMGEMDGSTTVLRLQAVKSTPMVGWIAKDTLTSHEGSGLAADLFRKTEGGFTGRRVDLHGCVPG